MAVQAVLTNGSSTINFNSGVADANSALWYMTDLEGWDSPSMRQDVQSATSRHGSVMAESMVDARALTISGICKAPSETQFWASYNNLLALTSNPQTEFTFKVTEGATTKQVKVLRAGGVRLKFIGVGAFEFDIPLIAPDPFKYADTETVLNLAAGTHTINNAGTFETYPTITLTASSSDYYFQNSTIGTGARLGNYASYLNGSGTEHNFYKRTVVNGTRDRYLTLDPTSVWWALLPGNNTVVISGVSVEFRYRSAWI